MRIYSSILFGAAGSLDAVNILRHSVLSSMPDQRPQCLWAGSSRSDACNVELAIRQNNLDPQRLSCTMLRHHRRRFAPHRPEDYARASDCWQHHATVSVPDGLYSCCSQLPAGICQVYSFCTVCLTGSQSGLTTEVGESGLLHGMIRHNSWSKG